MPCDVCFSVTDLIAFCRTVDISFPVGCLHSRPIIPASIKLACFTTYGGLPPEIISSSLNNIII